MTTKGGACKTTYKAERSSWLSTGIEHLSKKRRNELPKELSAGLLPETRSQEQKSMVTRQVEELGRRADPRVYGSKPKENYLLLARLIATRVGGLR